MAGDVEPRTEDLAIVDDVVVKAETPAMAHAARRIALVKDVVMVMVVSVIDNTAMFVLLSVFVEQQVKETKRICFNVKQGRRQPPTVRLRLVRVKILLFTNNSGMQIVDSMDYLDLASTILFELELHWPTNVQNRANSVQR